jgi:hypothetical protein
LVRSSFDARGAALGKGEVADWVWILEEVPALVNMGGLGTS